MKLSTKGRYGVRLMLDLTVHYGQQPVLLRDIAKRQEISEKYLWQLINPLKNAGLVKSLRGVKGGYMLAKPPEQITLKDIVVVLEGGLCLVDCVKSPSACKRSNACVVRDVWKITTDRLLETLASFTLVDLMEKEKGKKMFSGYMI